MKMKMQKSVIFIKKNLKINIWKIKKVRDHCQYLEEYKGSMHSICNLKYPVHKNIHIVSLRLSIYHKRVSIRI